MCLSPHSFYSARWRLVLLALLLGSFVSTPLHAAYEAEMAAFAAQDAANPPPADVIVFTGSSSITGWSGLASAFPDYPVLNRGFGGSQMNDVLEKFGSVITPYQAPLYVLYEGDNDIQAGETPAAIFSEYVAFVDRLETELPGSDLIIIAVKPSPSRVARLSAMAELNGMLRDLCAARPKLRYADVFTPMLDASGQPRPELFGSDQLHMNAAGYAIWKTVLDPLLAAAPFDTGHTVQLDFGSSSAVPASGWNNITDTIGANPQGRLSAMVNAGGTATAMGLEIVSPFNALNETGTLLSGVFPAAATRDSLFGNTAEFGGSSNVFPVFRLTGLDPEFVYRLTFFASRTGVNDNRQTLYTVTGATTATAVLDASNNVNGMAIVEAMRPDAGQAITVSLTAGPANTSPNRFTYLGILKVDGTPPPPADLTPPVLLSGVGKSGRVIELNFNEPLDPASLTPLGQYQINGGTAAATAAILLPGNRTLSLTLDQTLIGSVTVQVTGIRDAVGNALPAGASATFQMPGAQGGVLLFDFGGGTTTPPTGNPAQTWNNITPSVGSLDTGVLNGLVTLANQPTSASLRMIRRFNGSNTNGTSASTRFPATATSDSLFGNTASFSGLSNIFPSFQLTGLDPAQPYDFVFYASRTGVSDNRTTRYTLTGATTTSTDLQVANNINTVAEAKGLFPTAAGEITISLSATPANNNANHFTYLGAMQVSPAPPVDLLAPFLSAGRIHLQWTGTGHLEHAPAPHGPWEAIQPIPASPWSTPLLPDSHRFYRLRYPVP